MKKVAPAPPYVSGISIPINPSPNSSASRSARLAALALHLRHARADARLGELAHRLAKDPFLFGQTP